MRDPHPRVNGAGALILRDAGVEVIEGVCEPEVRRQPGLWVLEQHPYEPLRRAQALPEQERVSRLAEVYGVDRCRIEVFLAKHLLSDDGGISSTDGTLPKNGLPPTPLRAIVTRRRRSGTFGPRAFQGPTMNARTPVVPGARLLVSPRP